MTAFPHFPGYVVTRVLGRGASGDVYFATQHGTQRGVAIKALPDARLGVPAAKAALVAEAEQLALFDHPGIPALFELGSVDGGAGEGARSFFAMEYFEGEQLVEAASKLQTTRERVQLIVDLCEVCEHIHRRGVVHRDLKPENVLVAPASDDGGGGRPVPQVVDFGIALRDTASQTGAPRQQGAGTLLYMSPEQLAVEDAELDCRADVYALGALLYRVLAGRPPLEYASMNWPAAAHALSHVEPPALGSLVAETRGDLETVVQTALSKRREERYATASDLAAELGRWLEGRPVVARPPNVLTSLSMLVRRHKFATAGFLAIVVALLLGVVLVQSQIREAEAALESFDALALGVQVRRAVRDSGALVPPWPEHAPTMERFLRTQADPVVESLSALRTASRSITSGEDATATERFLQDRLAQIGAEIEAFADVESGQREIVRRRLDWARSIEERSISEHRGAWDRAIADLAEQGHDLIPQYGLVPLGRDPSSGLEEFAHLASGAVPSRDPATGKLQLDAASGMVLVLIPAAVSTIGAQRHEPDAVHFDPEASDAEDPVHDVALDAYFIAKHELSRSQWRRLGWEPDDEPSDRPMVNVDWYAAARRLENWGLRLPTEAQWEHAARAGTNTPRWMGADPASLRQSVNLRDQAAGRDTKAGPAVQLQAWDDGYGAAAPVYTMLPNPWGLHHVLGNAAEWCQDWRTNFDSSNPAPGDGEHLSTNSGEKMARGGHWNTLLHDLRSSRRFHEAPTNANRILGLRAARTVHGKR